jgi:hypothetical protein
MTVKPPLLRMAMVACNLIALASHLLVTCSAIGTLLRGLGGNARSVARAGWSLVRLRALAYGLAGYFGVLAGMALVGLTTSADANMAPRYTLLSIARGRGTRGADPDPRGELPEPVAGLVDPVRDRLQQFLEKLAGRRSGGLAVEPGHCELRGPVDGHEQGELALPSTHLGDVHVEEADRVALEALLGWLVALKIGQPGDAMALQAAMRAEERVSAGIEG